MSDAYAGPQLVFSRSSKFSFEAYEDLTPSTKPWRIKNAWPQKGVVWIAGASGAAKTFFALDGLLKLAAGAEKVWGRRAHQCGVVYVAAEDPDGCKARVRAWKQTKGSRRTSPMPFKLSPQPFNLLDGGDVEDFIASMHVEADAMAQAGSPLGVIAIDTFSCCIPGADENSGIDMSRALEVLTAIAREFDALVVVVAHFGKSGTAGSIRGWSGLGFNADGMIILERGDAAKEEDPNERFVTFKKVKNGVDGGRLSFTLEEVDLGMVDDDCDPMTSCVVRFKETAPLPTKRRKLGPEDKPGPKIVLRALGQLLDVGQTFVVPPVPGVPPGTSGVERSALRDRARAIGHPSSELKDETAKRMINRDIADLIAAGKLREEDGIIWRVRG